MAALDWWPALGYLVLLMFNNYLIGGWQLVPTWLGTAVVMMVFVLIYVLMFMRQMSARQEAQTLLAELETAHRQLAEYAQEVETLTLEAERQRMARELHDTLAQGLAGLILQLEGLEAHLERGNLAKVVEIAAQAKGRARSTLAEARQAIGDLREQGELSSFGAHQAGSRALCTGHRHSLCRGTAPNSRCLTKRESTWPVLSARGWKMWRAMRRQRGWRCRVW